MKSKAIAIFGALLLFAAFRANAVLLGNPLFVNTLTNSPPFPGTNTLTVFMPSFTETISSITNGVTQLTNNIIASFVTNGVTFTVTASYVFNASSNGLGAASIATPLSFTTNYPAVSANVPVYTILQVAPQSGGSNTVFILAQ